MKLINMKTGLKKYHEGSSLFISLVILGLLSIIGATSLNSSMVELRAAGNVNKSMASFQKSDAGINAAMSLVGEAQDPFNSNDVADPFTSFSADDHPLRYVSDVSVSTTIQQAASACTRNKNGSSANKVACEYYEIQSTHNTVNSGVSATTRQGIRRQIIAF
ncbi:hypothetical protein MNBD_GAMMA16-680 [hydrothermal vent metagenome]|uniref:Type 4 fimbrial biogenesis protein PilX N-terminal domain-containing protein n=1 Tax=hydrothermal vent metagenome TaxID=652676 RepID=A0A3B0ZLR7_9ZZZZ